MKIAAESGLLKSFIHFSLSHPTTPYISFWPCCVEGLLRHRVGLTWRATVELQSSDSVQPGPLAAQGRGTEPR